MITDIKTHIFYVVVICIGVIAFASWLSEHDARLRSDVAVSELETHIRQNDATTFAKVQTVTKVIRQVKTPAQAIAAIPDVSELPLNTRALPDAPTQVAVDAQPLFTELANCNIEKLELDSCNSDLHDTQQVVIALKKKPSFWHRVEKTSIIIGIAFGAGVLARR